MSFGLLSSLSSKSRVFVGFSRRVDGRAVVLRDFLGGATLAVHQRPVGEPQEPAHGDVPFVIRHPFLP